MPRVSMVAPERGRRPSARVARVLARLVVAGLILVVGLDLLGLRDLALPHTRAAATSEFRITSPEPAAVLGDGNIVLVEGLAADALDGRVDRVEVAFDDQETWVTAQFDAADRWRYLWMDPPPGTHRIRARVFGLAGQDVVEQAIEVQVREGWSLSYVIANPYATPGSYRKGQLHTHSTNSFDGWTSLPPAELALEHKRRGYQFIAITDHDVVSHPSEVDDATFVTLPAYESTADTGHITGLFVTQPSAPDRTPQDRLDHIASQGGMAILNHPGWRVGWTGSDFETLHGYFALELFNGITTTDVRAERNVALWHEVLNAKGWSGRTWAVAVDDAHSVGSIGRGWVMVKCAQLTPAAIRQALERGAFYASNGPSFSTLGVRAGVITAASRDAAAIRFIDQDLRVLKEGPPSEASYKPTGAERWIRVEAVMHDGRTAWSQPFWLLPNAPRAALQDRAIVGQTLPRALVHVSDRGRYQGHVTADDQGAFVFPTRSLDDGPHELWIVATPSWPDQFESAGTLLFVPAWTSAHRPGAPSTGLSSLLATSL